MDTVDSSRDYELSVLFDPDLEENDLSAEVEKLEEFASSKGGKFTSKEMWGRKELAYPIKKKSSAFYVFFRLSAGTDFAVPLERYLRINDRVLRNLLIKASAPETQASQPEVPAPSVAVSEA